MFKVKICLVRSLEIHYVNHRQLTHFFVVSTLTRCTVFIKSLTEPFLGFKTGFKIDLENIHFFNMKI